MKSGGTCPSFCWVWSCFNAGPTWSSTGSEASCAAVKKACEELLSYLKPAKESLIKDKALQDITSAQDYWRKIIGKVYDPASVGYSPATVPLSARGFFDGTETGGSISDTLLSVSINRSKVSSSRVPPKSQINSNTMQSSSWPTSHFHLILRHEWRRLIAWARHLSIYFCCVQILPWESWLLCVPVVRLTV